VSGIGPILWQPTPGLGPPRSNQREETGTGSSHRRYAATLFAAATRPTGRRGGFPTGRSWVFASEVLSSRDPLRAEARRCRVPEPVPRIWVALVLVTLNLFDRWARPFAYRGTLSPRGERSLAATLTRIAYWRFYAHQFRVALSLAAGSRRARNHLLRTVFAFRNRPLATRLMCPSINWASS